MSVSSEWLSRKLGYGFAYDENLPRPEEWIEAARAQVAKVPKFDPWRLIAKNPSAKSLAERQLPSDVTAIKGWDLTVDALRYPDDLPRAVRHFNEMMRVKDKVFKLQAEGKISLEERNRIWWKKYNQFSWWRDTLTRGLDNSFGDTPVLNRFWHFWINHFSLNTESCEGELFGSFYLSLRGNLTKKFEDMLFDALWHPAMQEFLNNVASVGPNSRLSKRNRENGRGALSINENLAREVLELYTVTPAANYRQEDVNAVAYILTGFGTHSDANSRIADFYFMEDLHEPGIHKVMGKAYNQNSAIDALRSLCKDLASHPLTAQHIAKKLAKHFISDEPPEDSINTIRDAYIKSNGSLVTLHQTVIEEVAKQGPKFRKFLAPELWFWQLHRATKKSFWMDFMGKDPNQGSDQINSRLFELGQLHSKAPQPNGWPDYEAEWITPEFLDRRIRYAHMLGFKLANSPESETGKMSDFDPKNYIERLAPEDMDITRLVKRAESFPVSVAILFCSERFMRA